MARNGKFMMQFGILADGKWTGEWTRSEAEKVAPTIHSLRAPAQYWVITDAQLARDLKGRTLADVYRDNHTGRSADGLHNYSPAFGKYVPRTINDFGIARTSRSAWAHGSRYTGLTLGQEYLAWCKARNHTPHPGSIDPDHEINRYREKCPKREIMKNEPMIHVEDYWREAA